MYLLLLFSVQSQRIVDCLNQFDNDLNGLLLRIFLSGLFSNYVIHFEAHCLYLLEILGVGLDSRESKKASQMASLHPLPVPCFRGGSQKSPWLVSAIDLAAYIDKLRAQAQKDWEKMN